MPSTNPNRKWLMPVLSTAAIVLLWVFPSLWYTQRSSEKGSWLAEQQQIDGWRYEAIPVAQAAESALVADRLVNGEFENPQGAKVRVFSAKRYQEKANEIGLFIHTPDRCWSQAGWKVEPADPQVVEVEVHGIRIPFERRIFTSPVQRELVYFAGMIGGQPLPYRLDHHLSIAMRQGQGKDVDGTGTTLRASDSRFWVRLWDSFLSRRQLLGAKHFLRISTPVGADVAASDERLREFLPKWLKPTDYATELATAGRR
jgi:hypothetical protein